MYYKAVCIVCFEFSLHLLQDLIDCGETKTKKRRENHTVLERLRRSEQRNLFDKLQAVLRSDPRAPRLRLLSLVSSACCIFPSKVETARQLMGKCNSTEGCVHFLLLFNTFYHNNKVMFSLSCPER